MKMQRGQKKGLFDHSIHEYWMVGKAFCVVMGFVVLLRVKSFEKVRGLADIQGRVATSSSDEALEAYTTSVVRAVRAVARRFLGNKPCLPQALAVKYFLSKAGKESTLEIGVVKSDQGALDAHAWLVVDGDIIIGGRRMSKKFVQLHPLQVEREKVSI